MAKIRITQDNLLTSEEFRRRLEEIEENASPMDDLLDLMRQLITFEQQHNMSSDVFYARFMRGEMGDAMDFVRWAGRYDLFLDLKGELEAQLSTTTGVYDAEKVLEPAL